MRPGSKITSDTVQKLLSTYKLKDLEPYRSTLVVHLQNLWELLSTRFPVSLRNGGGNHDCTFGIDPPDIEHPQVDPDIRILFLLGVFLHTISQRLPTSVGRPAGREPENIDLTIDQKNIDKTMSIPAGITLISVSSLPIFSRLLMVSMIRDIRGGTPSCN